MSKRPYPQRYYQFLGIARALGLSCPSGRALYAINRLYNGWPRTEKFSIDRMDASAFLRRVRVKTARRWLTHWREGGKLQSLTKNGQPNLRRT